MISLELSLILFIVDMYQFGFLSSISSSLIFLYFFSLFVCFFFFFEIPLLISTNLVTDSDLNNIYSFSPHLLYINHIYNPVFN